jgi:hypothetical protein
MLIWHLKTSVRTVVSVYLAGMHQLYLRAALHIRSSVV